ncbi:MAG: hypothetical protein IPG50_39550 [Myxococcales bacterium]|nr:hypothetical protein [Myxococcales bacterium]
MSDRPPPLSKRDFEARLQALQRGAAGNDNVGCVAMDRCERCTDCTFCALGHELLRCHHTTNCARCTDCSNCADCRSCVQCTRCEASENCTKSAYLVRSYGCSGCTYCFGCVGLRGRDFHILNEPYDRESYFRITAALSRELGLGKVV